MMTSSASNPTVSPNKTPPAKRVEDPLKAQTLADNVAVPKPRFSAEMPKIPGVGGLATPDGQARARMIWGRAAVAVGAFLVLASAGAWIMTRTKHSETAQAVPVLQPSPAVAELPALPATGAAAGHEIGTIEQFTAPWSAKKFTYTNTLTEQQTPAIAIRLAGGNGRTAASYWAILLKAPFGSCALEYVSDTKEIASRFGFSATHPMIADACSNTLYDPTRMGTLPNGSWARGDIVQGAGYRPPLQVEIRIDGNKLIAGRSED
jgi:hypothetical protein